MRSALDWPSPRHARRVRKVGASILFEYVWPLSPQKGPARGMTSQWRFLRDDGGRTRLRSSNPAASDLCTLASFD